MKKSLTVTLAAVFALGIASSALAANPFVDVPAKHWAYGAVSQLSRDGVINGYSDNTFRGDRMISRYEMASIVAKAIAKAESANTGDKMLISKLAAEFKSELDSMGVRMDSLEKGMDGLAIHGTARIRNNQEYTDAGRQTTESHINIDAFMNYNVNDQWAVKGESEWQRGLGSYAGNLIDANSQFEQLYVTGPLGGTAVKGGKYSYFSPYGLVFDDKVSGAQATFGNVLKTGINAGKVNDNVGTGFNTSNPVDTNYASIDFSAPLSRATTAKAAYFRTSVADTKANYYEVGFNTKFGTDLAFTADFAKSDSDAPTGNKAYYTQVQYKAADYNLPGSYDVYAAYRKIPTTAVIAPTGDWTNDTKGVRLGVDYTLAKNIGMSTWYTIGKTVSADTKKNDARVEFDFKF